MEERKGALDPDKGEEQVEKKKVKTRRKRARVVSRFFQDGATNQQNQGCNSGCRKQRREKRSNEKAERVVSRFFQKNQGCISGSHTERRNKRSHETAERVVSRFFQNREQEEIDEPIASTAEKRIDEKKERLTSRFFQNREPEVSLKRSQCSKGENRSSIVVVGREIAEIGKPMASMEDKRIEKSDAKKERVLSRFFQNQEPRVNLKLLRGSGGGNPGGVAALDIGREVIDIDGLFSCFAYKKGSDSSASNSKDKTLSTKFQNREAKSDSGPSIWKRTDRTDSKAPAVKAKKKEVGSRSGNLAMEKNKEAYRRKDVNNTWKPPRSVHRLLQEDHAHDPWRVLVICMLLNLTTGKQTGKILENLFREFPDAKAAADAPEERIEEIIKTLGLQKKRSRMIKRMSQEYISEGWTHVTQLHGVGKYAADAYAIFCNGKWYEVTPVDHKLKDYWDYLWTNEDKFK